MSLPGLWLDAGTSYPFPVANVVVGARYGLDPNHEARLHLHPLPAISSGIIGIEGGWVWHARAARGWQPAVHLTTDLSLFTYPPAWSDGVDDALRAAVDVAVIAHLEPAPWLWPYVVVDNAFVIAGAGWVGSVLVGVQTPLGERWEVSLESGLAGFNDDTSRRTAPYAGMLGRGALWLSLAVGYRFDNGA